MEPQTYYISVSSRTIETQPSRSEQLTIQATDEELELLRQKLDREDRDYARTSGRAMVPYKSAERDPATQTFSDNLLDLYAYVDELGTPETRAHIESMNLLPKLMNQNSILPGYDK